MVGITPQRLTVLNKAARLPTSMSTPMGKAGDMQADTLEDTIEVQCLFCWNLSPVEP